MPSTRQISISCSTRWVTLSVSMISTTGLPPESPTSSCSPAPPPRSPTLTAGCSETGGTSSPATVAGNPALAPALETLRLPPLPNHQPPSLPPRPLLSPHLHLPRRPRRRPPRLRRLPQKSLPFRPVALALAPLLGAGSSVEVLDIPVPRDVRLG